MLGRVNRVLVTNVETNNTGTSLPTIINGDMLVLNNAFSNLTGTPTITSATDNHTIYIAQGIATGKAILSTPIQLKNVLRVTRGAYVAPAEQVTHIGYDGTSGTLQPALNLTEYRLNILYKDDQRIMVNRDTRGIYYYTSDAAATLTEITTALVRKVNGDRFATVSAVMLTNGTFSASSGGAFAVVKGSKYITTVESAGAAADAGKYAADASSMAVGDLIRIGGTGNTSPVYKIAAVSGIGTAAATITLDSVYEGATASVSAANVGVITVPTSFGIKLTAEAVVYNGIDKYQKVSFDVSMYAEDQAEETVTYTTAMALGQGFWQQVRDMEYDAQGYLGVTNRTLFPLGNLGSGTPATRAVDTNLYNFLIIEHTFKHPGDLQGQYEAPMTTVIAFSSASAPTKSTKETTIIDILESLFESAGVFVE